MPLATRESILNARDHEYTIVSVPKWGDVRVRSLTVPERLALTDTFGDEPKGKDAPLALCRIIALAAVDENDAPLFSEQDAELLLNKNWGNIKLLADEILQFNGISTEVAKEAEKNLGQTESAASPSVSA